jgi:hypothetical protein
MKLYYRIEDSQDIKVDLLLNSNPELEIPLQMVPSHFEYIADLPVAPLYFVLYHKLLGWEDRVNASEFWKRKRAGTRDYNHILGLCQEAWYRDVYPLSKSHMGRLYLDNFYRRADGFTDQYPVAEYFRRIGFGF